MPSLHHPRVEMAGRCFAHVLYDADQDVLHLRTTPEARPARVTLAREGHAISYDADGGLVALSLVDLARTAAERGELVVTAGDRGRLDRLAGARLEFLLEAVGAH